MLARGLLSSLDFLPAPESLLYSCEWFLIALIEGIIKDETKRTRLSDAAIP